MQYANKTLKLISIYPVLPILTGEILTGYKMKRIFLCFLTILISISYAFASNKYNTLKIDQVHVNKWNDFVSELYQLHLDKIKNIPLQTKETIGGYGGTFANKNFYREVSYFNKNTNKLLSKIQWEVDNPDTIHTIEVYLYDDLGRIKIDYYARYLPDARNAPVQTLINLHNYNDNLHAFRQFDANGELIYETCRGLFFNEKINLHLDDEEIVDFRNENSDEMLNEAYSYCFTNVAKNASDYLHPNRFIHNKNKVDDARLSINFHILTLSQKIKQQPKHAKLYIKRGKIFFDLHEFDKAISDFNTAISLDNTQYQAFFWRGMALARNGQIQAGIKDLTIYIKHNPNDSMAYTKRGVRYIWAGELDKAKQDLLIAIKLDHSNAEAHDDLGVIYAQKKNFEMALKHFNLAIKNEPSYQKAYHNQAMVLTLINSPQQALIAINKSLSFDSDSRNSLILKSEILSALGKNKEAKIIMDKAEFLPEGNWSERLSIQQ